MIQIDVSQQGSPQDFAPRTPMPSLGAPAPEVVPSLGMLTPVSAPLDASLGVLVPGVPLPGMLDASSLDMPDASHSAPTSCAPVTRPQAPTLLVSKDLHEPPLRAITRSHARLLQEGLHHGLLGVVHNQIGAFTRRRFSKGAHHSSLLLPIKRRQSMLLFLFKSCHQHQLFTSIQAINDVNQELSSSPTLLLHFMYGAP